MIKVISFDMDGTLVDELFDKLIWWREIPYLYAKKHGLTFQDAHKEVKKEYKRLWGKTKERRNVNFWFNHFKFKENWKDVMDEIAHEVNVYPEVKPLLDKLKKKYKLIIITHAGESFMRVKLNDEWLKSYFDSIFSTTADFNNDRKDIEIYKKIPNKLNIKPEEIVHVGDDYEFDYPVPKKLGIKAIYLDRKGNHRNRFAISGKFKNSVFQLKKGKDIIHDLGQLKI